jgi:hypothetical protein
MTWPINLKIDIQRWNYRRKQKKAKRLDLDKMAKAIIKANLQSERTKKRLWVIKFAPADYQILVKPQVKAFFRTIRPMINVNFYHTNEYVIHITRKPE